MGASSRFLIAFCLLVALVGCAPAEPPLPTLMPLAVLPPILPTATPTVTKTAVPSPTATFTPTPTHTPTAAPSPTPTLTPSATPTPVPVPHYIVGGQVQPPYLETPPGSVTCRGVGVLFRSRYRSDYGGPWRYYTAYLPPCYGQQGRTYPVLYLFHGSIQTDTHWAELGLPQIVDAGIANGRYPPFIVIMPYNDTQGNETSGGPRSIEGITLDALIPTIDATYCTWPEAAGRAIGGISRGGYWALMIAFRNPQLFRSVSGHSSHLRYETDKATYNPLSTYAGADLSNLRIWLDWGETDFLRHGQRALHNALLEAGIVHEATINEGGHNEAYWRAHIQEYLDWHAAAWPLEAAAYPPCEGRHGVSTAVP